VDAAEYLHIPLSKAYAVATFYRSLSLDPRGKHVIKVCDGTACHIRNSEAVFICLERLLGVKAGDTDEDGLFTVESVGCIGTCALAPVMQIGDAYFGALTDEKVTDVIAKIRKDEDEGAHV
jgi:NADH-quinone oxidoreductase subunit E